MTKPGDALTKATEAVGAESYHKTKHPPDLLPRLDLSALRRQFIEVERLMVKLNV